MRLLPTCSNEGRDGERNGLALWREIKAAGYTGTERSVYRHLETLKRVEVKASVNGERIQKFSANTAIWLFVRDPKKLDEVEREDLAAFCQASTPLERAYQLIQAFLTMVHKREGHRLDAWLEQVRVSGPPELQSFAAGVERDKDAVQAGLTWWINNGQVEGQVRKLKLIKRQMYGKAGFALLRKPSASRIVAIRPSRSLSSILLETSTTTHRAKGRWFFTRWGVSFGWVRFRDVKVCSFLWRKTWSPPLLPNDTIPCVVYWQAANKQAAI